MAELNDITTEMMEHVCDHICKHPGQVKAKGISQDVLDLICSECKMGKFVNEIASVVEDKHEPVYRRQFMKKFLRNG